MDRGPFYVMFYEVKYARAWCLNLCMDLPIASGKESVQLITGEPFRMKDYSLEEMKQLAEKLVDEGFKNLGIWVEEDKKEKRNDDINCRP